MVAAARTVTEMAIIVFLFTDSNIYFRGIYERD